MSLLAVALLTAGYELVREASRRYEASSAEYMNSLPSTYMLVLVQVRELSSPRLRPCLDDGVDSSSFLQLGGKASQAERKAKIIKASLYAVQVFYSFFIM